MNKCESLFCPTAITSSLFQQWRARQPSLIQSTHSVAGMSHRDRDLGPPGSLGCCPELVLLFVIEHLGPHC